MTANPAPLASSLQGLLAHLGVAPVTERDASTAALDDTLRRFGHHATVVEIRWGCAVVEADAVTVKMLGFDRDRILADLDGTAAAHLSGLRFRVRR